MGSIAVARGVPPGRACAAVAERQPGGRVEWQHPAAPGDNARLEAWCRAVGPVVIDSLPSADFGPLARTGEITVAAWNTDGGSGDLMAFVRSELSVECASDRSALGPGGTHFVLMIQEALRRSNDIPVVERSWATPPPVRELAHPGPRVDIRQVASACGLSLFYAPAGRNGPEPRDGSLEDKGNAILATVPLSAFAVIELPYENARRVVPVATVRSPAGGALRVASVHLITTPGPLRTLVTGNSARMRQTLVLLAALRRLGGDEAAPAPACDPDCAGGPSGPWPTPTVAAGDFNAFSRREIAIRRLRRAFPDSPPALRVGTRGALPTDHLFFASDETRSVTLVPGTYRRVAERYYSDHNAVLARFAFHD